MKLPFAPPEKLNDIAESYGTPVYIYNETGIIETARRVKHAFSWNPGYRQFFAVKATPTAAVLSVLKSEGIYVECSSMAELRLAQAVGFSGEEILFAPNYPLREDVNTAAELNTMVNLDGLELIDHFYKAGLIKGVAGMRFNPGGEFYVNNTLISKPKDAKFGFSYDGLLKGAISLKRYGTPGFGLHGYMGGNIQEEGYYEALSELLMSTAAEISRKSGLRLRFINLSGGIGVGYEPGQPTLDIEMIGQSVKRAYEKILLPEGFGDVAIYTELGRYMTAPHGLLLTRVNYIKNIYKNYIGVDASSADLMRPMLYGAYHHMTVVGKEGAPLESVCDVVGSVCENTDKLAIDRHLPKVQAGDLIAIHDVGGHSHAMGYNYGGKLRAAEVLLQKDGSTRLIRRRETVEDYLRTQIFD